MRHDHLARRRRADPQPNPADEVLAEVDQDPPVGPAGDRQRFEGVLDRDGRIDLRLERAVGRLHRLDRCPAGAVEAGCIPAVLPGAGFDDLPHLLVGVPDGAGARRPGVVSRDDGRRPVGMVDLQSGQEGEVGAVAEGADPPDVTRVPTIPEHGSDRVGAGVDELGDVVGLVRQALVVVGPAGRQFVPAHPPAVDAGLVDAEGRRVQPSADDGDVGVQREVLAQIGARPVGRELATARRIPVRAHGFGQHPGTAVASGQPRVVRAEPDRVTRRDPHRGRKEESRGLRGSGSGGDLDRVHALSPGGDVAGGCDAVMCDRAPVDRDGQVFGSHGEELYSRHTSSLGEPNRRPEGRGSAGRRTAGCPDAPQCRREPVRVECRCRAGPGGFGGADPTCAELVIAGDRPGELESRGDRPVGRSAVVGGRPDTPPTPGPRRQRAARVRDVGGRPAVDRPGVPQRRDRFVPRVSRVGDHPDSEARLPGGADPGEPPRQQRMRVGDRDRIDQPLGAQVEHRPFVGRGVGTGVGGRGCWHRNSSGRDGRLVGSAGGSWLSDRVTRDDDRTGHRPRMRHPA